MNIENVFQRTEYKPAKVKQIKEFFDTGCDVDLQQCGDFYLVGELLKAYFRELPEPLIPRDLQGKFEELKGKELNQLYWRYCPTIVASDHVQW
jgi:hypothetical protein